MAPKRKLYKVRSGRCITLKASHGRGMVNWAVAGDIIDASHPLLFAEMEEQLSKLTPLDRLPKGAKVRDDFPHFYKKRMRDHDRNAVSRAVDIGQIEIDTQIEELQRDNAELRKTIKALQDELEALKVAQ